MFIWSKILFLILYSITISIGQNMDSLPLLELEEKEYKPSPKHKEDYKVNPNIYFCIIDKLTTKEIKNILNRKCIFNFYMYYSKNLENVDSVKIYKTCRGIKRKITNKLICKKCLKLINIEFGEYAKKYYSQSEEETPLYIIYIDDVKLSLLNKMKRKLEEDVPTQKPKD